MQQGAAGTLHSKVAIAEAAARPLRRRRQQLRQEGDANRTHRTCRQPVSKSQFLGELELGEKRSLELGDMDIYVCIYVYINMCIYIYVYIYTYVYTNMYAC